MNRQRHILNRSQQLDWRRRSGFTLIELLVVIVIIAILASMIIVVFGQTGQNARIAGTETVLKELDSALQDRLGGFERANLRSEVNSFLVSADVDPSASGIQSLASLGMGYSEGESLYRMLVYRGAFPQRIQDLWGFDGADNGFSDSPRRLRRGDDAPLLGIIRRILIEKYSLNLANSTDRTRLTNFLTPGNSDFLFGGATGSSELLYITLTEGESFGAAPVDLDLVPDLYVANTDIGDQTDPDHDKMEEFVDGWGQPFRFYNAPTALLRPNGNVPNFSTTPASPTQPITVARYLQAQQLIHSLPKMPINVSGSMVNLAPSVYTNPLNIDPWDPIDDLRSLLSNQTQHNTFESRFHSVNTYYTPLIVSVGPDERLGLFEPDDTGGTNGTNRLCKVISGQVSDIFDNLTNKQRGGL